LNFKGNFPNKLEECHLHVAIHLFETYLSLIYNVESIKQSSTAQEIAQIFLFHGEVNLVLFQVEVVLSDAGSCMESDIINYGMTDCVPICKMTSNQSPVTTTAY
jgi:hypothetical protein